MRRFKECSLTASRASIATLAFFASNSSVNTLDIFAPSSDKNACQNACWGTSPNPAGCGPVLTLRALTLGQNVPKQKYPGTAQNCSPADRKMWKVFSNIRAGHIIVFPLKKRGWKPLKAGRFFGLNVHTSALLFEVFPVAKNTAAPLPIRTPHTRRSFRCLLRGGCFFMRDLFHHVFIGTVCKVHK